MIFKYNNKRYKTKETLEDLEYLERYVHDNQCSGILTNLNLGYQGNFPVEQRRCQRSINKDLSKLKSLCVIYVTKRGGRKTIRVKNKATGEIEKKHSYICGRYLINNVMFILLYALCSFPYPNENLAYFKKNPPRLDFNRLIHFWDMLCKTLDIGTALRSVGISEHWYSDNKTDRLFRAVAYYLILLIVTNVDLYNNLAFKELLPPFALLERLLRTPYMLVATPLTTTLDRVDDLSTPAAYDTPSHRISATYADAGACDDSLGDVNNFVKYEVTRFYDDTDIDAVVPYWSVSIVLGPGVSVTLSPDTSPVVSSSQYTGTFPHHTIPKLDEVWFTCESKKTYKRTDMVNLHPEEDYTYKCNPRTLKRMKERCEKQDFSKFRFVTKTELTPEEIEDFKADYANCLVRHSITLRRCCREVHRIRELSARKDMHFNLNIKVTKGESNPKKQRFVYYVSIKGRHHNPMADVPSKLRNVAAQTELSSFDLHAASFAVLRFFNIGEFNATDDLKEDIIRSGLMDCFDVTFEEKIKLLKPILYRCIFSKSRKQARSQYSRALRRGEVDQRIETSKFMELYDYVQEWVNGSEGKGASIFFLESHFELMITRILMESFPEGRIENVYDCFYYCPTQVKEADVERTCSAVADEITAHYNHLQYTQPKALGIRA